MSEEMKLILALDQVHNLLSLTSGNKYERFFKSHLFSVKYELQRQLTNSQHSAKIIKS